MGMGEAQGIVLEVGRTRSDKVELDRLAPNVHSLEQLRHVAGGGRGCGALLDDLVQDVLRHLLALVMHQAHAALAVLLGNPE